VAKTILFKRGDNVMLPDLQNGEPGWADDANYLYVGQASGAAPVLINIPHSGFMAGVVQEEDLAAVLTEMGLDTDLATLSLPANTTISAYGKTLVDDASASAALTTLGVSTYGKTLIDDASASDALTTLGVTAFAKTMLDDADAAAVRATLAISAVVSEGIRPEDYGAVADDSTDCTAAINAAAAAAGSAGMMKLSSGIYRVTSTTSNFALQISCSVRGESPKTSIIKQVGTGHAVLLSGVGGESIMFENFGIQGNASSQDGLHTAYTYVAGSELSYARFKSVDIFNHGGHGLLHRQAWGTRYTDCKFHNNGGIGAYISQAVGDYGTGGTAGRLVGNANAITFLNCDSRWNGGLGDNTGNYEKGGVRILSGANVNWIGGIIESNNAWGVMVSMGTDFCPYNINIVYAYFENCPPATSTTVTGGAIIADEAWEMLNVEKCLIGYGAILGSTGYGCYIVGDGEAKAKFNNEFNYYSNNGGAGTCTETYVTGTV
jgi:hypothetical protein